LPLEAIQKKAESGLPSQDGETGFKAKEKLASTHTEELVIALCGPVGSPLHDVAQTVAGLLREQFLYDKCEVIRLSRFIEEKNPGFAAASTFDRIINLIELGNELRNKYGAGVLAELAVNVIRLERERYKKEKNSDRYESRRICHIVDSIKNQEELDTLRTVYRDMLYVVGVFSPMERRESNLQKQGLSISEIYQLIDRDSGEESGTGQTVHKTFPQADFFLRVDAGTDTQLVGRVERFLYLILGTKIITPTFSETAMYAAASAAGNSACLSRQVGAAITDEDGSVIATGWNDVPCPGGGLYAYDPVHDPTGDADKRCWNKEGGKCFNDEEKELLAAALADTLEVAKIIPPENKADAAKALLENAKLKALIEFSRAIHAEMHAILNAGRSVGRKIAGGKIFVTTYPCHSCARHIIAAGLKEVYYIEPYRKSLATKLHDDAITEHEHAAPQMVRILPYDGVAPSKYFALFHMKPGSRKKDGKMIRVSLKTAKPQLEKSLEALPALEGIVVKSLISKKLIQQGETNGTATKPETA
jgi:deoxycytidylate deaminase